MSGSYGWSDAFENEDDDYGDNENNSLQSKEYKSKDAVIFLIDASRTMASPDPKADAKAATGPDGKPETHLSNVLQLAENFLKDKIIATRKDQVAFCFFNSRVAENPNAFRGIYVLNSLDEPDAALIKKVKKIKDPNVFDKQIGSYDAKDSKSVKSEFYQALWTCSAMFGERELKDCSKRIFLFTDTDSPDASTDLQNKAKQKSKDLLDLDITIELFPMTYSGTKFEIRKFFKELISFDADEDVGKISANFLSKFEDLETRFRKKEYKKRALATVAWELKKDTDISVKLYCLVREARPDTGSWLDSKTNNPLTCVTKWLCEETASHLEEHQMKKYYTYGGHKVFFSKDEMNTIKTFGPPGLTLMGFKPMKTLKVFHNIKPAYFMYPTEEKIRGSTVTFNALLQELVAQQKYAVGRMTYRKNGVPRFVAIVPQREELDAEGVQVKPPGMHMIFLPFADDVRSLKLPPTAIAENDLILKAKNIVKALKINFTPTDFENPSLQKHYANLQALALEEAAPDKVEDLVQPDENGMNKFADLLNDFRKATGVSKGALSDDEADGGGGGGDGSDDEGGGGGGGGGGGASKWKKKAKAESGSDDDAPKKRKAPSGASKAGAAKKVKTENGGASAAERDWKNLVATGGIQKLTMPELKEYLKLKGLTVSGKKQDLVERVTKHVLK